jgi:hypothetical protein
MWYFYNLADNGKPLVVLTQKDVHVLRYKETLELEPDAWNGFIAQCGSHRCEKQFANTPKFSIVVAKDGALQCMLPRCASRSQIEKDIKYYQKDALKIHSQSHKAVPWIYEHAEYCEEEESYVNPDFIQASQYIDSEVLWNEGKVSPLVK